MTTAQTFDYKYPEEKVTLTFDFTAGLAAIGAGVTLASIVSVGVQCYGVDGNLGTDPAPAAVLNGAAALDGTNKKVLQPVQGGKPGMSYLFSVVANTSQSGNPPLELKGILPVISV
jgi:hypothetical protein